MNTTGTTTTSSSWLEDYSALFGGAGVVIVIALFVAGFWGSKKFDLKLGWLWALGVALLPLPVLAFWIVAVIDAANNKNAVAPAKPEAPGAGLPCVGSPQGLPPFGAPSSELGQPRPGELAGAPGAQGPQGAPGAQGPQGVQGLGAAPFDRSQGAPGYAAPRDQRFTPAQPFGQPGAQAPQGLQAAYGPQGPQGAQPQGPSFSSTGGEDQPKPPTGQFAAQPFEQAQPFEPQSSQGSPFEQAQPFAPAQPFEQQDNAQSQAGQGSPFEQAQPFAPAQPFEVQHSPAQPIFPNQAPQAPGFPSAQPVRPEATGAWGAGHFTYPAANPQPAGNPDEAESEKKQG